ncbi:DUF4123 domain-containing protein [Bartonella sp. HY038]|uniref:DUF4123 domain-containing protein n=1 Tax=Bartonella sp. HY038 TaxID=2759660 RepID=UPI0015FD182E|nr:DUF4123 domain-containing protein [Bartonella sp. HY038]
MIAILEAGKSINGQTSDLVAAAGSYQPCEYQCILPQSFKEVSPYLFDLSKNNNNIDPTITHFNQWLFDQPKFAEWGIFLISKDSFYTIYNVIRRYINIDYTNNNIRAYFRVFDPRIFFTFFKSLSNEDKLSFEQCSKSILVFDFYNKNNIYTFSFLNEDITFNTIELDKIKEEKSFDFLYLLTN